jgi:hypothetical protein
VQCTNAAIAAPPPSEPQLEAGHEVHFTTETPDGDPLELTATIVSIDDNDGHEGEPTAVIRVGDAVQTRQVALAALRSTGFLAQVVRRWGSDEIVRREDARRLRTPPSGHESGRVALRTLRSHWLNTTVVNCLGRAMSTALPSVQVLPMQLGELALRSDFRLGLPKTERLCKQLLAIRGPVLFGRHVEMWLVPFCRSGHIFGALIHFRLRLIILVDSMGSSQSAPTDARRAAQLLTHELHRLADKGIFDWTGWKVSSLGKLTPQQGSDAVNCGVLLMACCWALASHISLTAVRPVDLARWRERFLVWLTDGGSSLLPQQAAMSD